ncbi:MAG: M50 family metallopeptidase [Candidatus Riflebacteria bacterium]|nr:M50 family metallopeptidase [Candidatus Riflebacteria bacterium]
MNENKQSFAGLGIPLALSIIALFFWNSVLILPIKLMTVFFHELSHGLAAIITGGKIIGIELNINQGGVCYHQGGWFLVVASAGYLGSLLWGSTIFLASLKNNISSIITKTIAVILIITTGLWIRNIQAIAITVTTAVALFYISANLEEKYCSMFLKFVSLVSCFYVVFDIKDDLLDRTIPISDAYQISKRIFPSIMVPAGSYLIGLLWLGIAIFVLWKIFKYALKHQ